MPRKMRHAAPLTLRFTLAGDCEAELHRKFYNHRTCASAAEADVRGAAMDSCRSAIMNLMEDQQSPQSAKGEAKIITLCGSTKFQAEFAEVNQRLTMEGCVVISLGMFSLPDLPHYDWTADSSDLKKRASAQTA